MHMDCMEILDHGIIMGAVDHVPADFGLDPQPGIARLRLEAVVVSKDIMLSARLVVTAADGAGVVCRPHTSPGTISTATITEASAVSRK